jgi:hypothetical protein
MVTGAWVSAHKGKAIKKNRVEESYLRNMGDIIGALVMV